MDLLGAEDEGEGEGVLIAEQDRLRTIYCKLAVPGEQNPSLALKASNYHLIDLWDDNTIPRALSHIPTSC
jgi:hypothetical protein